MATPNSIKAAREAVESIATQHGHVAEDRLRQIHPDLRREIEQALFSKDLMIGSSVITLAKNLYSSKARFVFELLQNADDNTYAKASSLGSKPFVSFRVFPRKIVVECNEDGFTQENLEAICAVGQSSKTGAQGYIGEKGIGFKSVFMVAHKVHIQSGSFSFSFGHKPGDSGMGMISPIWEETSEELESPLTKITLHLHDAGDQYELAKTRASIRSQFETLQAKMLPFLRNIRQIQVAFYDDHEEQTSSVTYDLTRLEPSHVLLKKIKTEKEASEESVQHFRTFHHTVEGLAKNENRTYSKSEEASQAYSKSEVILAFPISETSAPIIEPQEVFAFLPVRPVGFNFLIQADFVTEASRQDIVKDSRRNIGLLKGVAEAFAIAVTELSEHEALRYTWPSYLPDKKTGSWDAFWLSLVDEIGSKLRNAPAFYDHKGSGRRLLSDLLYAVPGMFDEYDELLLDDGDPAEVISQNYDATWLETLKNYGLQNATFETFFEWLEADLKNSETSRMKSRETTNAWHDHTAAILHFAVSKARSRKLFTARIKNMDLIPLESGYWRPASLGPIYLPCVSGLDIPVDVGLNILCREVKSEMRTLLFESLGVTSASLETVKQAIAQQYANAEARERVTLQASNNHLRFLYLAENLDSKTGKPLQCFYVFDQHLRLRQPLIEIVYLPNNDTNGPQEVFRKTDPGPNAGDYAPGHDAVFAHDLYFCEEPLKPGNQKVSWRTWFTKHASLRTHIDFNAPRTSSLPILKNDAEYIRIFRPDKFMECLLQWYQAQAKGTISAETIKRLREVEVLCRHKIPYATAPLAVVYFPVQRLQKKVSRFLNDVDFFPWLWLNGNETHDEIPQRWKGLLSDLNFGCPGNDLDFALDILHFFIQESLESSYHWTRESLAKLFKLYQHIQIQCAESDNRGTAVQTVRNLFNKNEFIHIPLAKGDCEWVLPGVCVWDAPQSMATKHVLNRLYQPFLGAPSTMKSIYSSLFQETVGIGNCTIEIWVEELKQLKASECGDIDRIGKIYHALHQLILGKTEPKQVDLREIFENDALILVPSDDASLWYKTSQCVWSNAARLRGRVSLTDNYQKLEEFFVGHLGVKPLDFSMAIAELEDAAAKGAAVKELKESIWIVNSLLPSNCLASKPDIPHNIFSARIFPVSYPDGRVTAENFLNDFFIIDRESLGTMFKNKVRLLDFTLEQVARLRPFIEWLDLRRRYLSAQVTETTFCSGGATSPTSNPQRQIRNRAHALLRVAAHFDSPRCRTEKERDSFYSMLRSAEIYETDGISSNLSIFHDGAVHTVKGKQMTLHIDEREGSLKVYLPRAKDVQEYIFTNVLPKNFAEWMMNYHGEFTPESLTATKNIMLAPHSLLSRALTDSGIATVDVANCDEAVIPETPHAARKGGETRESASSSNWSNLTKSEGSETGKVFSPQQRSSFGGSQDHSVDEDRYLALLKNIVAAGRRSTNTLPVCGTFGMSQLQDSISGTGHYVDFGVRNLPTLERDFRIGAAGELFVSIYTVVNLSTFKDIWLRAPKHQVFELLSHLHDDGDPVLLPEFSRDVWQSSIRYLVKGHPDYTEMPQWDGYETSDIVYQDTSNLLTALFIEKGYLREQPRASVSSGLKYFIEVKATTGPCETPFFMSPAQYQRVGLLLIPFFIQTDPTVCDRAKKVQMESQFLTENSHAAYVIFRVYNLGRQNMGYKVYLDPEELKRRGQLSFTAEKWSVIPIQGCVGP
ncbi:uncharacterized protein CCOS01_14690 [Colletotrichum costaricense]|uniref:Protein NO VEIN C-terminal domain-containing protein n=1 Tax=Colletotrichum costaricense TaxID=1209916 RepID=A0AAI9YJ66_9PEZI|nr:uncharacterized protein CCOS01_14690 [Colletotrichum costaricense]KAK1512450.1 hypothetical protein CCOS01_14690 [Colletotrichum costaricense]